MAATGRTAVAGVTSLEVAACRQTAERDDHQGEEGGDQRAEQQRHRHALEDRIRQQHHRADDQRQRGDQDRPQADASGEHDGVAHRHAAADLRAGEFDQQDRISDDDAGERDETDHRGGGEIGAEQPVAGDDADQRQRDRRHHHQRQQERSELGHHQDVDQHQRRAEGDTHVTEGDVGDLPLAIPLEAGDTGVGGAAEIGAGDGETVGGDVALQRRVDREHAVQRRAEAADDVGGDVFERPQILVEDRALEAPRHEAAEFAERHGLAHLVADGQDQQVAEVDAGGERHLEDDDRLLEVGAAGERADLETTGRHLQLAVDVLDGDGEHAGLEAIDLELDIVVRHLHEGVHVGDVRRLLQDLHDVAGDLATDLLGRSVEFDDDGGEHRRAGRRFGDGQPGARRLGDRGQDLAHLGGDVVARAMALLLVGELDGDVALPRLRAQEVVAHQTVEVEGRRRADIGLEGLDLGDRLEFGAEPVRQIGGDVEIGALRHVDDDLHLRLVVVGQHLEGDHLDHEHGHREHHRDDDRDQRQAAEPAAVHDRVDQRAVPFGDDGGLLVLAFGGLLERAHRRLHTGGEPGHEDEGGDQREDHRGRRQHRDGQHVGAHHVGDEAHRQQRRDHGEGGEDGRVADFVDGVDGQFVVGVALVEPAPVDVLDHDDGVVDQNADGEDEREHRHAVDGELQDIGDRQRHQQHGRNGDQHDDRRPRAHGDEGEHRHQGRHDEQLEDQPRHLLVGGGTVVARDGDGDVGRNEHTLHRRQFGIERLGDVDAVGAPLLGDGDGDRRQGDEGAVGLAQRGVDDGLDLALALTDDGDVAQEDRLVLHHRHDEVADVAGMGQEVAGEDVEPTTAFDDVTGGHALVGRGDHLGHLAEGEAVGGERRGIDLDTDLLVAAADDEALAGVGQRLEALGDVEGELAQLDEIERRRRQGDGHDRHVVDALRLHQGRHDALGDQVHVAVELVVELDQRGFHLLADVEAHGDHRQAFARHRVDVLDPRQLRHQPLQRLGDEVGDFRSGRAGHGDEDVDHRHRDLRILLARRHHHAEGADEEEGDQQQRRDRTLDEGASGPAGDADAVSALRLLAVARVVGGVAHTPSPDHGRPAKS